MMSFFVFPPVVGGSSSWIDTEFVGSTVTFGGAVNPWDPGTDYGKITLIHVFTDNAARNVPRLAVRNAVQGTIVCLKNEGGLGGNPAHTANWQHLQTGTGQFRNSGAASATGGSLGVNWYVFNAGSSTWEQIFQTAGV